MTPTDAIRSKWKNKQAAIGLWLAMPSLVGAELAGVADFDYICIDQQHGLIGYESLVNMLIAIGQKGPVPITRVPFNDPDIIARSLDAGACGIVVPMVEDGKEAARAVAACRYPPEGIRSYGPTRSARMMGTRDPKELGEAVLCIVMIETQKGLDNVDEIAATQGIDALYIGPSDLAVGLGLPPSIDNSNEAHVKAVQKIFEACERQGVVTGMHCVNSSSGRTYVEHGFNMVTVAKDSVVLEQGYRESIALAKRAMN